MAAPVQTQVSDPWDSAENPQIRQPEYWGEAVIDTYFCVLVKDIGKMPFDPQQHDLGKRCTAIDIKVIPLAEMNVTSDISRGMIAESREWAGTVLPSIKAHGLSLRELNGKFVRIGFKETGETYVAKKGAHAGETLNKNTFNFIKVFASKDECVADYLSVNGGPVAQTAPWSDSTPTADAANPEKVTAVKFLKILVENAARGQKDLAVIQQTISVNLPSMPLVNKYFTADSPETLNLIMEAMK